MARSKKSKKGNVRKTTKRNSKAAIKKVEALQEAAAPSVEDINRLARLQDRFRELEQRFQAWEANLDQFRDKLKRAAA